MALPLLPLTLFGIGGYVVLKKPAAKVANSPPYPIDQTPTSYPTFTDDGSGKIQTITAVDNTNRAAIHSYFQGTNDLDNQPLVRFLGKNNGSDTVPY